MIIEKNCLEQKKMFFFNTPRTIKSAKKKTKLKKGLFL